MNNYFSKEDIHKSMITIELMDTMTDKSPEELLSWMLSECGTEKDKYCLFFNLGFGAKRSLDLIENIEQSKDETILN